MSMVNVNTDVIESKVLDAIPEGHSLSHEERESLVDAFISEQWDTNPELAADRERFGNDLVLSTEIPRWKEWARQRIVEKDAGWMRAQESMRLRAETTAMKQEAEALRARLDRDIANEQQREEERQHYLALWLDEGGLEAEFNNGGWQRIRERLMTERTLRADAEARQAVRNQYR